MRYLFIITALLTFLSNPANSALVKFEYDAAGNMVSEQGKYYEYNDANQLVRVKKDSPTGEILAEYVYDYQGQRVKKVENGVTTYYIGKHYEERKGKTVDEKTSYFFANSQRIAKSSQKNKAPPQVSYYLNNHLGSADVIIDENGKVLDNIKYLPFGGYRTFPKERHTYTGKERDEVTDNYYFEARYYNSNIRRFTQADTIIPDLYDPQSLNRYAYARNSPVVYTDPSGHIFWDIVDVLSFGHSVYSFAKDPSWANAGWLAADTVGLLPGIPGASTVKMGVKGAGAVVDVAKATDKATDVATVAKKAENASDAVTNVPVVYDAKFASEQLLNNGKISLDNAKSFVPKNSPNLFKSSDTIEAGQKYRFDINETKVEFKFHSPDANAALKYPGSNSGNLWTSQVKVDNKFLGADGQWYKKASDCTHIPIEGF